MMESANPPASRVESADLSRLAPRRRSHPRGMGVLGTVALAFILAVLVPQSSLAAVAPPRAEGDLTTPAVQVVPDIDDEHLRELIDFALSDASRRGSIAAFWSTVFPTLSDEAFREPSAYREYEAGRGPANGCLNSPAEATGNAFYCMLDESISWDIDLLRTMFGLFGDASTVAILAHEWGHHIQNVAGFPLVDKAAELQADCYAGMYLRHLGDLGALDHEDSAEALALFHSIGDDKLAPGELRDWFDADVHGDSQERTQAQGIGFVTGGVEYCRAYTLWADRPPADIGDGVTLRQPPGVPVTVRRDSLIFELPGTTITASVLPATSRSTEDALAQALRALGLSETQVGPVGPSMLEAQGWGSGRGARAPFERIAADGTAEKGVAEVLVDGRGVTRLFAATSTGDGMDDPSGPAGALDALLWGYCDPTAPVPLPCPSRSTSVSPPRVTPAPTPEAVPRVEPAPQPHITRRALEDALLDRMGFATCKPWRKQGEVHDPFAHGARAAVQCDTPALGLQQAAMFIFPDTSSMESYWRWRVTRIDPHPPRRSSACQQGMAAIQRWRHGELACYVDKSRTPYRARIRWTDERTNTYGVLDADDRSIERLFQWWSVVAG
jgi:predicted metalloprotease